MAKRTVAVPSEHPGGLEAPRSGHFGHCDVFTLVELDNSEILNVSTVHNGAHFQGGCHVPVQILHQSGADALIVGGIGMRPLMGFRQAGIEVFYGPQGETVRAAIDQLLQGHLQPIGDHQVCCGGGGGRF